MTLETETTAEAGKKEINLPEMYYDMISRYIDEEGVYPHQCFWIDKETGKVSVVALAVTPDQAMTKVFEFLPKASELIYSLDRSARDNQGTELGDLVAGCYWKDGEWTPFIIEYQNEPRIVKPMNWDNTWWNESLRKELTHFKQQRLRVRVDLRN